jgi:hypothetical protein
VLAPVVNEYPEGKPVAESVEVEPASVIAPPFVVIAEVLPSLIAPTSVDELVDAERDHRVARPPPVVTDEEAANSKSEVDLTSTPFSLAVANPVFISLSM